MSFQNSYMVTNRAPSPSGHTFDDSPQSPGSFSYTMAPGAYVADSSAFLAADASDFYAALRDDLGSLAAPKVTIFIHGLDTDWDGAVSFTSLLGGNLNGLNSGFSDAYEGLVLGFSWPSTSSVLDYLTDRANIRATAAAFVAFVQDLSAQLPAGTKVSWVCHSEGNYMMKVGADALLAAGVAPVFDQILLLAADLPDDSFVPEGYALNIAHLGAAVSVYFSNVDSTLLEANAVMDGLDGAGEAWNAKEFPEDYTSWWPTARRLGLWGVADLLNTPSNLLGLNCSLVDRGGVVPAPFSTHTGYFAVPQIVDDMGQVLSGTPPGEVSDRLTLPFSEGRSMVMNPASSASGSFAALEDRLRKRLASVGPA